MIFNIWILLAAIAGAQTPLDNLIYNGNSSYINSNGGYSRIGESNKIYVKNIKSGKTKVVYKGVGSLNFIQVSPRGTYVAMAEFIARQHGQPPGRMRHVIVEISTGKILYNVENNVRRMSWKEDETKLAFCVGMYREGGAGFDSEGVRILDIETGNSEFLDVEGYYLHWAEHDNAIYIRGFNRENTELGWSIYRYNPASKDLDITSHKGINFSPSGKYYSAFTVDAARHTLYDAATNRDVTPDWDVPPNLLFWLPDDRLLISGHRRGQRDKVIETVLYDLDTSTELERIDNDSPIHIHSVGGEARVLFGNRTMVYMNKKFERRVQNWRDNLDPVD